MELPTHVCIRKKMKVESCADVELAIASGLRSRAGSLVVASPRVTSSAALGRNRLYNRALNRSAGCLVNYLAARNP